MRAHAARIFVGTSAQRSHQSKRGRNGAISLCGRAPVSADDGLHATSVTASSSSTTTTHGPRGIERVCESALPEILCYCLVDTSRIADPCSGGGQKCGGGGGGGGGGAAAAGTSDLGGRKRLSYSADGDAWAGMGGQTMGAKRGKRGRERFTSVLDGGVQLARVAPAECPLRQKNKWEETLKSTSRPGHGYFLLELVNR